MRRERGGRVVLYGAALIVSASLVFASVYQGEPDVGTLLNGADALALVGAHDKAIVQCLKVLERDPGNLRAHLLLALCHDRSDEMDEAVAVYRKAVPLADDDQRLEVELAIADGLRRAGRFDEAVSECDRLVKDGHQTCARLFVVRGLAHAANGRQASAMDDLETAVSLNPQEPSFQDWLQRVERNEPMTP